ncbi:MAG: ribonuclease E activity regulator RraA [Gammaproteobacteria bacterium]|nr:ribonuclease E activity regulator RraA [Gammaproteobacteria bacterium]TVQ44292.1 MAG: RraA family protein [Gammaproteobacteria bacterium]
MSAAAPPHFATADLYDEFGDELEVPDPLFRHFGGQRRFCGPIRTVSTLEDNTQVRATLETPGDGHVLVVDGVGSLRVALVGDQLGQLAIDNHWAGLLVHGCVRDSAVLAQMPIGVLALATNPAKSRKQNQGQVDVPLRFAGASFVPGHWLYADDDGVVLCDRRLVD